MFNVKNFLYGFAILFGTLGAVPRPVEIPSLIGARFVIAPVMLGPLHKLGQPGLSAVPLDELYCCPLAGAVAWNSKLIEGLYRYVTEAEVPEIYALVQYLFHAQGDGGVVVTKRDHECVRAVIASGWWPVIIQAVHCARTQEELTELVRVVVKASGVGGRARRPELDAALCAAWRYAHRPEIEHRLPVQTIWLVLSAVWYATIERIHERIDVAQPTDKTHQERIAGIAEKLNQQLFADNLGDTAVSDEAKVALLAYNAADFGYPVYVVLSARDSKLTSEKGVLDCVEAALHNACNVLLFDPETGRFDPTKYLDRDCPLARYYALKGPEGKSPYTDPAVGCSEHAKQAWFELMEGIAGINYRRPTHCELEGDAVNTVKVMKYLCGITDGSVATWADLAKYFTKPGVQAVLWREPDTLAVSKLVHDSACKQLSMTWQFGVGHAEVHFGCGSNVALRRPFPGGFFPGALVKINDPVCDLLSSLLITRGAQVVDLHWMDGLPAECKRLIILTYQEGLVRDCLTFNFLLDEMAQCPKAREQAMVLLRKACDARNFTLLVSIYLEHYYAGMPPLIDMPTYRKALGDQLSAVVNGTMQAEHGKSAPPGATGKLLADSTPEERYALLSERPVGMGNINPLLVALELKEPKFITVLLDGLDLARVGKGLGKNLSGIISAIFKNGFLDYRVLCKDLMLDERYALFKEDCFDEGPFMIFSETNNPLYAALKHKNADAVTFLLNGMTADRVRNLLGDNLPKVICAALKTDLATARWLLADATAEEKYTLLKRQECAYNNPLWVAMAYKNSAAVDLLLDKLDRVRVRVGLGDNTSAITTFAIDRTSSNV